VRGWQRLLAAWALITLISALAFSAAAQSPFPASALIRGENVWVRAQPAEDTTVLAFLQRGDVVTLTGPAVAADGATFYPVAVDGVADGGWVRELFIRPSGIMPLGPASQPAPVVSRQDDRPRVRRAGANPRQERPARSDERPARTRDAKPRPSAPTPSPIPTVVPTREIASPSIASNPTGATARCKDGSLSFSEHRQGTCSHHGGVAVWYP
jgi:hypothetical protein